MKALTIREALTFSYPDDRVFDGSFPDTGVAVVFPYNGFNIFCPCCSATNRAKAVLDVLAIVAVDSEVDGGWSLASVSMMRAISWAGRLSG